MSYPVTTQPGFPVIKRDWHDGLFDCTNDCHSCWCILCCYPCYMCQMYSRYDECCGTPLAMIFPGLTLRVYHRAKHNIEGTIFNDCLVDYCCTPCAACQLDRDMTFVEQTKGLLNV
ncbi:Placenta-specificprotein 8 protein [Fasciola gigantica]|uniref:Placenta-specificprotein 8 protein n=2 Tax=Fasciola TaxID=6191 RepID=A0A2H1CXP3_FASHE|nr:Placenta-specificprotein 8 protein [Fasciola hepatica]TPP64841.1 Placenta-specificprotein 8 protein [Fasciola gigantica]